MLKSLQRSLEASQRKLVDSGDQNIVLATTEKSIEALQKCFSVQEIMEV